MGNVRGESEMKDGIELKHVMEIEEREFREEPPDFIEPSSRITPFGHEGSQGSEWVEIPPSLAERIREVTQRTGLSTEGIVWEALDFYVREKIYDWVSLGS